MRFSTVFCVLAAGAIAFAAAIPINTVPNGSSNMDVPNTSNNPDQQSSNTDVPTAFNNLDQQSSTPLGEFDNCMSDDCTTQAVNDLTTTLNNCGDIVKSVPNGSGDDNNATAVVNFVTKIVNGLEGHKTDCGDKCPKLANTYPALDSPLSTCLGTVFGVRPGLLALVTPQMTNLKASLEDLNFPDTLKACGLA